MLKEILNLNRVKNLSKSNLKTINGGANEYLYFKADGSSFSSTSGVSSTSVNCSIVAEVAKEGYFEFNYDDHIRP